MGLSNVITKALETTDSVTADLQESITHESYLSDDKWAKPTYSTGVARSCILERKRQFIRGLNGDMVISSSKLTFPRPVTVTSRDRFTLPDGTKPPIMKFSGPVNPTTSAEWMVEVWLG